MKKIQMLMSWMLALAATAVFAADRTWDGGGSDDNWTTIGNWGGTAPIADDTLFFGGTARLNNINNLPEGTAFSGITFNSGAGAFILGGNGFTLNGNVSNLSTTAKTINTPMILSSTRTIYGSNASFMLNGALSGAGGLIAAVTNSTLTLPGGNTYEGETIVTNGCQLVIKHGNALGGTDAGTRVFGRARGSLKLVGNIVVAEPITMTGQILPYNPNLIGSTGSNVITGPVYTEIDGRLQVESDATLVFAGGIIHSSGAGITLQPEPRAQMIITDKPLAFGTAASVIAEHGGTLIFAVPGNTFTALQVGSRCLARMAVADAFPPTASLIIGASWGPDGVVDLNGFDLTTAQLSTSLYSNPGYLAVTSAAPATLTINQSGSSTYAGAIDGPIRVVKQGNGTITFTSATSISTTTGEIVVNAGTLAISETGAFGASEVIRVNGGTLELRNGTALPDTAVLRVVLGGKAKIKTGVSETIDKLYLDGEQQASGTWGATGSGATHINDTFFNGSGVINVASGPTVSYSNALWDGGGSDANLSTLANWDGDTLPAFDGTARVTFASGGSAATVDAPVSFYSMIFNANTDFTVAAGAGIITNGAGGLRAGAPSPVSRTYTLSEDIVFGDHQIWSVTNNGAGITTLTATGILSDSDAAFDLIKRGSGALVLSGNNTYSGVTTVQSNGYIVIKHGNALGSAAGATEIQDGAYIRIDGGSGITVAEPLTMMGDASLGYAGALRSNTGSNIWSGKITASNTRLRCESGAYLEIIGGVDGVSLVCSAYGIGWIRFTENPITCPTLTSHTSDGGVILAVAGNTFTAFAACGRFIRIDVPNAWPRTCTLTQGNGGGASSLLNLNGNDQTVGAWSTAAFDSSPRILFSVAPATLTVDQSTDTLVNGSITGAVSIVKLGSGNLTLTNAFITTSGSFVVSNGTLTVANQGTLGPNSTNIVVGGTGTLALSSVNPSMIADVATVTMPAAGVSTAKINLAAGVNEEVGWLYYGDKMQRAGTHGATGSGAIHIDNTHFTGSGVLRVRHDNSGTMIIVL